MKIFIKRLTVVLDLWKGIKISF